MRRDPAFAASASWLKRPNTADQMTPGSYDTMATLCMVFLSMSSVFLGAHARFLAVPTGRDAQHAARRARSLRGLLLLALLICLSPLAWGRTGTTRPHAKEGRATQQAEALIAQGIAARTAKQTAQAAVLFQRAYMLAPQPHILYQLGLLALDDGRPLDAQDLLRRFLADPTLDSDPTGDPAQQEAERILLLASEPSASLTILGDRGTLVWIDGHFVGSLPLSLPLLVTPREHRVLLQRGARTLEDQVLVPRGRIGELRADIDSRASLLSILPAALTLATFEGISLELGARLLRTVEATLQTKRLSTQPAGLAQPGQGEQGPCTDPTACALQEARRLQIETLFQITAKQTASDLVLRATLLDAQVGAEASSAEATCSNCSADQASKTLRGLLSSACETGLGRPRGRLILHVEPSDARVSLDDKPWAQEPRERWVFAGAHRLVIDKPQFLPKTQDVIVAQERPSELHISLDAVEPPEPPPAALVPPAFRRVTIRERRPTWRLALGGVAIGGGALTAGFGLAMGWLDQRCEPDLSQPAPTTPCAFRYHTQPAATVVSGAGLLLIAGGIVLVAIPGKKRTLEVPLDGPGPVQ